MDLDLALDLLQDDAPSASQDLDEVLAEDDAAVADLESRLTEEFGLPEGLSEGTGTSGVGAEERQRGIEDELAAALGGGATEDPDADVERLDEVLEEALELTSEEGAIEAELAEALGADSEEDLDAGIESLEAILGNETATEERGIEAELADALGAEDGED